MQKVLDDANLKPSSALTTIMGKNGQAITQPPIAGQADPEHLLGLVQQGVKAPLLAAETCAVPSP